ncbi:DNA-binding domain of Mlu1-box binding protein MBP1 [Moesziomyces antarcticus]|uniref:DNA-binding domain of Mlu1-box binding protein MBP1 n=2 Tax=Pseudozyma antarctica TaxID=84753 RepID=A0A081CJ29_PSEA2|nr:DNA-binding domain of Mlu1-box binding protein MBP1 [Moesziomyces antarcticus]GAK66675.1 DNA-binding domain of Mlu1-box binding protein MBP1 [Moesziomyces antarcticus]
MSRGGRSTSVLRSRYGRCGLRACPPTAACSAGIGAKLQCQPRIKQETPRQSSADSSSSSEEAEAVRHLNGDKYLKTQLDLDSIAFAASLLVKMKTTASIPDSMELASNTDGRLGMHMGPGGMQKRGPPYMRKDAELLRRPSDAMKAEQAEGFFIGGPRPAKLFPTPIHELRKGKYATTGGDRGFMTVFEYDVRGHTMMIDVDTSLVRFTSITQALGKNKVNFGRLVRTCPALDPHITKLKGGYLSIQGTWLPYDLAKELSRRIAWDIRDHLVPLFGYDFPASCLRPDSEGFGQLAIGMSPKRARKRHNNGGPHQTSCYGPSLPISVVDGETIEHKTPGPGGMGLQPHVPVFHYTKAPGYDRAWCADEAATRHVMNAGQDSVMWQQAAANAACEPNLLQLSSLAAASHPQCPPTMLELDTNAANAGNSSSPIVSSPPSSNASSSSGSASHGYANYALMVPPTVPSHAAGNDALTDGGSASSLLLAHAPMSPPKTSSSANEAGTCTGMAELGYFDTKPPMWTATSQVAAYLPSRPIASTPPNGSGSSAPGAQAFQFEWQQPSVSS